MADTVIVVTVLSLMVISLAVDFAMVSVGERIAALGIMGAAAGMWMWERRLRR